MTREELYQTVWGRSYKKSDRSVDVYVGRLRAKLNRALPGRRFIHTHTGHRLPVLASGLTPSSSRPGHLHPFYNRATPA